MEGLNTLTEDDRILLKAAEPQAGYRKVDAVGISRGRQSKVEVLEFPSENVAGSPEGGPETSLVIYKRMGVDKGLTEAEADTLHARLRTYRRSLRKAGWNIPKLFNTFVAEAGAEYQVISFESYIPGGDGQYMAESPEQPNYKKYHLLRSAIETLAEYPDHLTHRQMVAGRMVTKLAVGMDLKLANLVQSPDSVLYFVDLFGPKELDTHGEWLTYAPKLESIDKESLLAVCATREGSILRLFRLAEQSWVSSGSLTRDELRENIPDVLIQSGLPDHEVEFVLAEIEQEYPWLDKLYEEGRI